MEKVRSKDGTLIAYRQSGEATSPSPGARHRGHVPALGARSSPAGKAHSPCTPWTGAVAARAAMQQRHPIRAQREFEDVAAVVDAIGGGANLFGHSYGAVSPWNPPSSRTASTARALRAPMKARVDPRRGHGYWTEWKTFWPPGTGRPFSTAFMGKWCECLRAGDHSNRCPHGRQGCCGPYPAQGAPRPTKGIASTPSGSASWPPADPSARGG